MPKILIIEDDRKLCHLIKECLQRYDFDVAEIRDFKEVEKEILLAEPDLILLDINLPYLDGFYLCRYMRKKLTAPIIIVSARDSDMEQIMGIELGADDYLVKPFSMELLVTKVKASLRRAYGEYAKSFVIMGSTDGLALNPNNFRMSYHGRETELSKNEFKLMKRLLEKKNCITSREDLLAELWDDQSFVEDNTLTVNMTRLKTKLEDLGLHQVIKTIRGAGYLLSLEEAGVEEDE